MGKRVALYLIIASLCMGTPQRAEAASYCSRIYAKLTEIPPAFKKEYLTDADRVKIREIFEAEGRTPAEKLKGAYDTYVEARLREYPQETRLRILERLEQIQAKASSNGKYVANASGIEIPKDLLGTAEEYSTLVHELEHNIQFHAVGLSQRKALKLVLEHLFTPRLQYVTEYGAMRAEWEFLHQVPLGYRMAAAARVEELVKDKRQASMIKEILLSADMSLPDYIANQHAIGRYSYGEALTRNASHWAYLAAFLMIGVTVTENGYKYACQKCEAMGRGTVQDICRTFCSPK